MEPLAQIAKQLQEFRHEISEQFRELRSEVVELKKQQGKLLAELQSGKRLRHPAGDETAQSDKAQSANIEMYCSQCLQLRPVGGVKRVVLRDGSKALEGQCVVCGTTAFRKTSLSGVLIGEAASFRVGPQED